MEFKKVNFFFFMVFNVICMVKPDGCDRNSCKGPYSIQEPKDIQVKVDLEKVLFRCVKAPDSVKMFTGFRRMHWQRVDNPAIGSKKITNGIHAMRPTESELNEWESKKAWSRGRECLQEMYDCWATFLPEGFCGSKETNVWETETKQWKDFGVFWSVWPGDTCIQSWSGGVSESKVKVYYNSAGSLVTFQNNWGEVELLGSTKTYLDVDENTKTMFDKISVTKEDLKFNCGALGDNVICNLGNDPWLPVETQGSVVTVVGKRFYIHNIFCDMVGDFSNTNGVISGHPALSNAADTQSSGGERNCHEGHIFQDGRIVPQTLKNQENCAVLNEKTQEIPLTKSSKFDLNVLHIPPPDPDPSLWEGWTWVSTTKDQLNDLSSVFSQSNISESPAAWLQKWDLSKLKLTSGFLGLSGMTTWVVLIIVICLLRK